MDSITAAANMANTIIGSGILGLSACADAGGVLLYSVFLVAACLSTITGVLFLVGASEMSSSAKSYESLASTAMGPTGVLITTAAVLVQCLGAMTSYLMILCDVGPQIIGTVSPVRIESSVLLCVFIILLWFLCCLRDLRSLRGVSLFAVGVYMAFSITTVIYAIGGFTEQVDDKPPVEWVKFSPDVIVRFPTCLFAFNCATVVLPIYSQLREPSIKTMRTVAGLAYGFVFVVYFCSSIAGYMTFRGQVKSNLLDNYSQDSQWLNVMRLLMTATIFSYPFSCVGARQALAYVLFRPDKPGPLPFHQHVGLSTFIVLFTATCAMKIPDLKYAFGITGSTATVLVAYLLPSLFHLIMTYRDTLPAAKNTRSYGSVTLQKETRAGAFLGRDIGNVLMIGVSCVVMAVALTTNITVLMQGRDS
ncbi:unnamed protein product [Vitrella brassicaformis CCMP3155]|uniref:Amino acid transporter transmembrane domain-containing protein n=1 Tax=Vitrella brassicaformis (strain CCMP3155) TaxID=1169540 RepID=A0A0G4ESL1_VITBC|nr:unnamed protein product [Vitrella brassicaformis CCMP3155]|eukprot:CEM00855.1 unnamed protein product [Vitrella brassicaformis CCMP3155]